MNNPVVVPVKQTLSSVTGFASGELAAVSGDPILLAPAEPVCAIDGRWLDALAQGLTEHGWISVDVRECLGQELFAGLREEVIILDRTDAMKRAGIGRGTDHVQDRSVRRDSIAWLQGITVPQSALFDFFEAVRTGLNQRLFLGLKRFESHYATYQPGDFYRRHVDSFVGRASRVVSLVLYLNEQWRPEDGGALQVYSRENPGEACETVLPEEGRMVLFLSEEIPHEVLPAHRTRYSVACWFRQDEVPIPL